MRAPVHPVVAERIARHGFVDRRARNVEQAAALTTAIQAQDAQACRLGIRARARGVTEADMRHAIDTDRTVVRTWLMRATIHLVAADDVRWLTAIIGPSFARKFRKRWLDLGLTGGLLSRTVGELPAVLADGPLTRGEIMDRLAERGVVVDRADQAPSHVLLHATGVGLLCRGADRGRDATFALLDAWLPDAPAGPQGDDALAELARRFFRAFSPATPADFTTWSGMASGRAVSLIRDELTPVDVAGRAGFTLGAVEPQRGLRLIAGYDNYLVGYRDRDLIIDAAYRPAEYVGGVIRPTVLLDGRVVGMWRLVRRPNAARIEVTAFVPLSRAARSALDAEIDDIGRFVGLPTTLSVTDG